MINGLLIVSGWNSEIIESLLEKLSWPSSSASEIVIRLRDGLIQDFDEADVQDDDEECKYRTPNNDENMMVLVPIQVFKAATKHKRIANRLGINLEKAYSIKEI